jgi:hypothetical protein
MANTDATDVSAAAGDLDPSLWAIGRLRDTAKWLIGAYAAVGTVLIAGLQLTGLGGIEDHDHLRWAIVGAGSALAAVVVGIVFVARVLVPIDVDDEKVAKEGRKADREAMALDLGLRFGGQAARFEVLKTQYVRARDAFVKAREDGGENLDQLRKEMVELYEPLARLRYAALLRRVKWRFNVAQAVLFVASAVVAAGVILFAWAANPSDADNAKAKAERVGPTLEQPSPVTLTIDAKRDSLATLRAALGDGCAPYRDIEAIAIGGSVGHPEVVTLGTGGCQIVRFTVTSQVGFAYGTKRSP